MIDRELENRLDQIDADNRRIEAKLDSIAVALSNKAWDSAKSWVDYADNHGVAHPHIQRQLKKAGRTAKSREDDDESTRVRA